MDLAEWWQQKRWRGLLELIDQLPAASRFNEAVLNDPEQARLIAARPTSSESWTPLVRDWDLTAVLLREIREALVGLLGNGRAKPIPIPRTEVDRVRARLDLVLAAQIIRDFAPRRGV